MVADSIHFVSAGLFTSSGDGWIHPERRNDTTELLLMQKGTAYLEEGSVEYVLNAGDFLRIDPQVFHRGFRHSEGTVSFYWVHFSGPVAEGVLRKRFVPPERYRLELICRQILHYANTPDYPPEAADYLVRLLVLELAAQSNNPSDGSARINEICEWIRVKSDRALKSSETAAHFGYNEDYLSRLFRQKYGIGLKQYIAEARMRRIKTLLLSPDYTLQEIAAMTGFSEYKYFLKFFRYHEGVTPTGFRSMYFNTHTNDR